MAKPYSNDLRHKALDYYKKCQNKSKTCTVFKIASLFALKKLGWSHKKRVFSKDKSAKIGRAVFQSFLPQWKQQL